MESRSEWRQSKACALKHMASPPPLKPGASGKTSPQNLS